MDKCVIALVENEEDIINICNKNNGKEIFWIALEPFCIPTLEKEKFTYKIIEDYFSREEFFADVSLVSERRIEVITNLVDTWVQENFPNFRENNISILKYSNYYLTILFDGIFARVYQLNKLFETLKPQHIIICKRNVNAQGNSEFPWGKDESVWAYCAELIHKREKFTLELLHYNVQNKLKGEKESIYSLVQRRIPFSYQILKTLKNKSIMEAFRFLYKDKIAVLNLGYQWRHIEDLFNEKGFQVVNIILKSNARLKRRVRHDFIADATNINAQFIFDGIDLTPLLKNKLNVIIEEGLEFYFFEYKYAISLLKKINAKALCFSVITKPAGWIFVQAAKNLQIPVFCWGHGASGHAKFSKQIKNELMVTDYYFAQGDGSRETYQQNCKTTVEILSVGFPTLDLLVEKHKFFKEAAEYKYLYVTTNYVQNNFYFIFYPGFFDNSFFMSQKEIFTFLENVNEKVLFKGYNSALYSNYPIKLDEEKISLETQRPFSELLNLSEAIIIDIPTTTLLEALTTNKPIFVLTQFLELNEHAENLLRKRAVCSSHAEKLVKELEYFQKTGIYKGDVSNKEYLKAFGTHLNDGFSAHRGVNEILNRIQSRQKISAN